MGINVVETKEARPEEEVMAGEEPEHDEEEEEKEGWNGSVEIQPYKTPGKPSAKEPAGRTDDPVHMYLK